jgi:flagellin-like protein
MRRITKIKRSVRAISPVIATLLMIAIAVVASLIVYAWVMGYIGSGTTKASNSMLIQSTSFQTGSLVVYVQNVGQGTIELRQGESVYVNSILKTITSSTPTITTGTVMFAPGTTASLATDYPFTTVNEKLKIKITATDGTFAEYTTTGSINIIGTFPAWPTARFTMSTSNPNVGQSVTFTDTSTRGTGTINQWSWNFGDGTTSSAKNPSHPYSTIGSNTVTLTVTDTNSRTATTTHTLAVSDFAPPSASFTFTPLAPNIGQTITFTDTSLAGSGTITQRVWSFGGGASPATTSYSSAGQKDVTLTVTNTNGKTSTTTRLVNVAYDAPTAEFTISPPNPSVGQTITFTDVSIPGSTGIINLWSWNFGDSATSATQNPTHSYSTPGTKTVTLTVTDSNAKTSIVTHTMSINDNVSPVADFTFTPIVPAISQSVVFTDTSVAGSGTINQWSWSFGNGASPASSIVQNPTASYSSEGQKTVSLTITDSNGKTSTTTQTLQVTTAATPTPTQPPGPTPTPTQNPANVQVTFTVNPSGYGTVSPAGTQTYTTSQSVSILSTPNTGYAFSSWGSTGTIAITNTLSSSTNAQMNSAGIITANFALAAGNKLVFTAGTGQTLLTNTPSAMITVQRQNSASTAITAGSTSISLSSTAGAFYSDSTCTNQITIVTIDSPQSTASFYYKSTTSGTPTLTASTTGYQSATTQFAINNPPSTVQVTFAVNPSSPQGGTTNPTIGAHTYNVGQSVSISATPNTNYVFSSWTFNGAIQITNPASASTTATINGAGTITANFISSTANKLVFTANAGQTLVVYDPSAPITVQRQNSDGTQRTSDSLPVNLDTTSSGGKFYSDLACTNQISSVTISGGSSIASFYYRDSNQGTPTITATATSYQTAATTFTINKATGTTAIATGFDGATWDQYWKVWTNPPWEKGTDQYVSSPASAMSVHSTQGSFTSDKVAASNVAYIEVTFYFRITSTDLTDFQVYYGSTASDSYNDVTWVHLADLGSYSLNTWHPITITITDTAAFTDYFRFQFRSQSLSSAAAIWVDNVQIVLYK